MAKPYSEDLRRRVVEAIESGAIIPDAAEQCGVSISSVVRFLKLHRDMGSVSAAKFGGYKDFVLAEHEELVRSLIEEQPDITLAELKARLAKKRVSVGKSSIARFLAHLKLPFKKSLRAAEQEQFLAPTLKRGDIVFMDNVSVNKVDGVEEAIKARGAIPFYLPAYSPDFNPIEQLFSKLKAMLRMLRAFPD